MTQDQQPIQDVDRLETLWSGQFGDEYVERNRAAGEHRGPFWQMILAAFPSRRILEVGCNTGENLRWMVSGRSSRDVYGVDINEGALDTLRQRLPGVNAVWSPARELPFREGWFDLSFTAGVLIHQPPEALPVVMAELVRTSKQWVLCAEYYAPELTEIRYRGQTGALFKQDFGGLYQRLFPQLSLRRKGFLSRDEGWDDVTYWMFEKQQS